MDNTAVKVILVIGVLFLGMNLYARATGQSFGPWNLLSGQGWARALAGGGLSGFAGTAQQDLTSRAADGVGVGGVQVARVAAFNPARFS